MRTLAHKLRFMTLSEAELESVLPLLQEYLSTKEVQAVLLAVKSGDNSKLPKRFDSSYVRRNPLSLGAGEQVIGTEGTSKALSRPQSPLKAILNSSSIEREKLNSSPVKNGRNIEDTQVVKEEKETESEIVQNLLEDHRV